MHWTSMYDHNNNDKGKPLPIEDLVTLNGYNVFTSESKNRKKIGKVTKIDRNYLVVYRKGVVSDEEYRIPTSAITHFNREERRINLKLSKNQLKHGFEFVKAKPNSDFVAGKTNSGYKILLEKELVHYESLGAEEKGSSNDNNIIDNIKNEKLSSSTTNEFICEMCMERFNESNKLQRHRIDNHNIHDHCYYVLFSAAILH
jgi:hypothetical protein